MSTPHGALKKIKGSSCSFGGPPKKTEDQFFLLLYVELALARAWNLLL